MKRSPDAPRAARRTAPDLRPLAGPPGDDDERTIGAARDPFDQACRSIERALPALAPPAGGTITRTH